MNAVRPAFAALAVLALATPLTATSVRCDESGNLIVRLGRDTTAVEHFTITKTRIEIDQVGRSPRVTRRHLVYELASSGSVTRMSVRATAAGAPAGAPALQDITGSFAGDSVTVETRRDTSVQRQRFGVPAGTVVITNASPWAVYETQTTKLAGQKGDSLRAALYYLGASDLSWIAVRRLGKDSMVVQTGNNLYHARVDKQGQIQNLVPIVGTAAMSLERVARLDLEAASAAFLARESQAGPMGALSVRDSVRASIGGAAIAIDYSRPGKRGRTIFGGVVPWGEVWRTGANAATQLRTDKALEIGGQTLAAGTYTLWTIPSPTGWKLIINADTGEWGTQYKPDKDLLKLDMTVSTLPQVVERFTIAVEPSGAGGMLNLDWDTTRAAIAFTVKP